MIPTPRPVSVMSVTRLPFCPAVYVFIGTPHTLKNMLTTMSRYNMLDGTYMVIYIDMEYIDEGSTSKSNSRYMLRR